MRKMRLFIPAVAVSAFLLLLTSGCSTSSMIKASLGMWTHPNRIMIHKDPQVGDYAVYRLRSYHRGNLTMQMTMEYSIAGNEGDLYKVRIQFKEIADPNAHEHAVGKLEFLYLVQPNGTVNAAWLVDLADKSRKRLTLAEPGHDNHVDYERIPLQGTATVPVPAGGMDITRLYVTRPESSPRFTIAGFNPQVKFAKVKSITVAPSFAARMFAHTLGDFGKLIQTMSAMSSVEKNKAKTTMVDMLVQDRKLLPQIVEIYELVEQGRR